MIVIFVGRKNSGKTTAAEGLMTIGFRPWSFANPLKDTLAAIFRWPRDMLEGNTTDSRIWREQVDVWWARKLGIPHFTPRFALEHVGTDLFRDHFHQDIWINSAERSLDMFEAQGERDVVLVDGRFPNEIALARSRGGLVFGIEKGEQPEWYNTAFLANQGNLDAASKMRDEFGVHLSEYAWVGQSLDGIIQNNGAIEDLKTAVKDLVSEQKP